MNKYYEGSIYTNYYLDGIAGVFGSFFSQWIYPKVKIRMSLVISVSLSLVGAVFLLLF